MSTSEPSRPVDATSRSAARGPLVVSAVNPRYFAVAGNDRDVVYLTGSHFNNNLHDGLGPGRECPGTPELFDFDAYVRFLVDHGHNFIRLWRWEQFKGYLPGADVHFCMTPQPWARTGPGGASDGKARFDLSTFDPAYFDRLRERVVAAGEAGLYVSVMLFEGFSLHLTATPDNVAGHPFHASNNINGVGITSIVDYQVLPIDPRIEALQVAYIRKVVDTVQDLPNVLYEVANESSGMTADAVRMPDGMTIDTPIGDSTRWQYWVIGEVKRYEQEQGYSAHPVGMTFQYPVADQRTANDTLWAGPADWISPGFDDGPTPADSRWRLDPPPNDGTKVVISDTDHYSPMGSDALWAWKSFLRGHNPILYDLGIFGGLPPPDQSAGDPSYDSLEPARHALGDTRRFAADVDLAAVEPRGDLTSTGYALAWPGHQYVVLRPGGSDPSITVTLQPGTYTARWFDVDHRREQDAGPVHADRSTTVTVRSPFDVGTSSVIHLGSTAPATEQG
jgi:Family of unknown function (DUF6298)